MLVSCLCVCHDKPDLIPAAVQSILDQSYPNWEAIVVDSGALYDVGFYDRFPWRQDPRIRLIRSDETDDTRRAKAMAPWCFNECFRKGLVSGDLVMYLCDDDILYTNAFATFVSYCRDHPNVRAMYASQDIGLIHADGWQAIVGERRATEAAGKSCNGKIMDCHVDYLQLCHKTDILTLFNGNEYWPEDKAAEAHADGIFMERIGALTPIVPIDVKVSQNRRTPRSTNMPLRSEADPFASLRHLETFLAQDIDGEPTLMRHRARSAEKSPAVTICIAHCNQGDSLPVVLDSVERQSFVDLEVLVIDAGSTDHRSITVFDALRSRFPRFRFLRRPHAGFALAHDYGLHEARGTYFIPMEGDSAACPDMVARFVTGMKKPNLGALTCFVLADTDAVQGLGIFDTALLRASGGFSIAPDGRRQDWQVFRKLLNAGHRVEIVPEHLFYRCRRDRACPTDQDDFSNVVGEFGNFRTVGELLAAERKGSLWSAIDACTQRLGQHQELDHRYRELDGRYQDLERQYLAVVDQNEALWKSRGSLRYRIADGLHAICRQIPFAEQWCRRLLRACLTAGKPS